MRSLSTFAIGLLRIVSRPKQSRLTGAIAIMLLATAATRPASAADTPVTIGLSSSNFGAMAALATADAAGLFQARGIAPKFITMENGATAMAALIAGSVQFTVSGPAEVVAGRSHGRDLVFVANLYRGLSGSLVVSKSAMAKMTARPDSPLNDRIKALDGMIVAVPSPTSSLLTPIKLVAETNGVKIRFTYMGQTSMPSALERGSIQGMMASSPIWMTPVEKGTGVVWINGPKGELPANALPLMSGGLSTTGDFARSHNELVKQIVGALQDLAKMISSNPDQAKQAFAKAYPALDPNTIDRAFKAEAVNFGAPVLSVEDLAHELAGLPGEGAATSGGTAVHAGDLLYVPK